MNQKRIAIIGYSADIISKILGKCLSVSSIRVKKFIETTQFSSLINKMGFIPSISLEDNSDKPTYETE